jgi:hypothetical protein
MSYSKYSVIFFGKYLCEDKRQSKQTKINNLNFNCFYGLPLQGKKLHLQENDLIKIKLYTSCLIRLNRTQSYTKVLKIRSPISQKAKWRPLNTVGAIFIYRVSSFTDLYHFFCSI